jgi:hypothetical protein
MLPGVVESRTIEAISSASAAATASTTAGASSIVMAVHHYPGDMRYRPLLH